MADNWTNNEKIEDLLEHYEEEDCNLAVCYHFAILPMYIEV